MKTAELKVIPVKDLKPVEYKDLWYHGCDPSPYKKYRKWGKIKITYIDGY